MQWRLEAAPGYGASEDQLLLLSSSGAVLATIEGHERGRGKHKGLKTLAAPTGELGSAHRFSVGARW